MSIHVDGKKQEDTMAERREHIQPDDDLNRSVSEKLDCTLPSVSMMVRSAVETGRGRERSSMCW